MEYIIFSMWTKRRHTLITNFISYCWRILIGYGVQSNPLIMVKFPFYPSNFGSLSAGFYQFESMLLKQVMSKLIGKGDDGEELPSRYTIPLLGILQRRLVTWGTALLTSPNEVETGYLLFPNVMRQYPICKMHHPLDMPWCHLSVAPSGYEMRTRNCRPIVFYPGFEEVVEWSRYARKILYESPIIWA